MMSWMDWIGQLELREPWLLLSALIAVPIFLISRRATSKLGFSSLRLLPEHSHTWRTRLLWVPDALIAVAAIAFAVALAGPRIPDQEITVSREGIAIMMVIDTSGSMQALDLSPQTLDRTRLQVARDVFTAFVTGDDALSGRPNDAIGLVTFAQAADSRVPLTLDHDLLAELASAIDIADEEESSRTAIGDGLNLATVRLKRSKAASKVIILLTDGRANAGEPPEKAAENARSKGIKVYTIGVGTKSPQAPVRVKDRSGRERIQTMRNEPLDEEMLKRIADTTQGEYFRATDAASLAQIYAQIDRLERTELDEARLVEYSEHFEGFVSAGLLLAIAGWLLSGTAFRRLP